MSVTYDFKIIGQSGIDRISLIEAQNETDYQFITDEENLATLPDGCAPVFDKSIDEFIHDAENAHLTCVLVWVYL